MEHFLAADIRESDQKDNLFAPGKPVATVFRSNDKTERAILNE
jgi:hypothetical protein